jgi:hypothetical protein
MKNHLHIIRNAMIGLFAISALALLLAPSATAQDASTSYKGAGRDPFTKYKPPPPPKRKVGKQAPAPFAIPSIQERIEKYKAQKLAAMNAQLTAPKPTTALLLNEFQITGIFRTPRGYAAMVEATPIKLSYVIYPGESFYDGQLVAIEENRLIFRRETRWTDGRRDMAVETKPLRQANAVTDSMTSSRSSSSAASPSPEAAGSKEEKAPDSGNQ